jgi:hypothetical protein
VDRRDLEKKNFCTCKSPSTESMRAGDMICCSLDNESCAQEASRLQGFCYYNAMEVFVKRCGGVEVLDFSDFLALLTSFIAFSLTFLAFF